MQTIFIDIDNTICLTEGCDYPNSKPILERIQKINKLYNEGNRIIYWTARGAKSGLDWTKLTTEQLKKWGCKYHKLKLDKPFYDIFIDDKNINSELYFK